MNITALRKLAAVKRAYDEDGEEYDAGQRRIGTVGENALRAEHPVGDNESIGVDWKSVKAMIDSIQAAKA